MYVTFTIAMFAIQLVYITVTKAYVAISAVSATVNKNSVAVKVVSFTVTIDFVGLIRPSPKGRPLQECPSYCMFPS